MPVSDLTETVSQWIVEAQRIIVFTGAGVSTESGIPDFRSPGGLWDRYDPEEFYFQKFVTSEKSRKAYWRMHSELYGLMKGVKPNKVVRHTSSFDNLEHKIYLWTTPLKKIDNQ